MLEKAPPEKQNFWELIESNKKQTVFLFIILAVILLILGFLIGYFRWGIIGGYWGLLGALALWAIFATISYFISDQIILNISGAGIPDKNTFKPLYNILNEVKLAAGLEVNPDLLIVDEGAPNAFTLGKKPEQSVIVLTSGLLAQFSRDEIQAVLAHEVAHIIHRDNLLMTNAVALGWLIIILSTVLRGNIGGAKGGRRSSNKMMGGSAIIIIGLVFSILAPLITIVIIKSISRKRVYLADATAVRLTRFPAALISAMEKISVSSMPYVHKNRMTAILFFDDPYKNNTPLFVSHPALHKRIRILQTLGDSANYYDYNNAFSKVTNQKHLMPISLLRNTESLPILNAVVNNQPLFTSTSSTHIMANDIIRSMLNYTFIKCDKCGMQFKLPEDFVKPSITCPRCGTNVKNPHPEVKLSTKEEDEAEKEKLHSLIIKKIDGEEHYYYKRKHANSWETFTCICGDAKQLSPFFKEKQFYCVNCGRKIEIT